MTPRTPEARLEVKHDREPAEADYPAEVFDTLTATVADASVVVEILTRESATEPPVVFFGLYVGEHRSKRYIFGELTDLRVPDLLTLEASFSAVMRELRQRGLVPSTAGREG